MCQTPRGTPNQFQLWGVEKTGKKEGAGVRTLDNKRRVKEMRDPRSWSNFRIPLVPIKTTPSLFYIFTHTHTKCTGKSKNVSFLRKVLTR